MSKSDDWQHVGKVKFKTKSEQEKAFKKMPKVKDLDYDVQQALMFQYDPKELSGEPLADRSNILKSRPNAKSKAGKDGGTQDKKDEPKQVEKKPIKKSDSQKPPNIDKALKNATWASSLGNKLKKLKTSFPNDPNIWFREISGYVNINLTFSDELLIPTQKRPLDFPMSQTTSDIIKVLDGLFTNDIKVATVPHIFEQYILTMLECISRDIPTWGYKLCIQAMAHHHPDLCCEDLSLYKNKLSTFHNMPKQCVSLLWALGQTGVRNSKCGLKVWFELMLPNLHLKSVAQFAMPYIEAILNQPKSTVANLASTLKAKEFLEIAKWCFGNLSSVKGSTGTRDRMKALYPKFSQFVTNSKASSRQTFATLMDRPDDETPEMSEELSKISVECISKHEVCLRTWKDCYPSSLQQSRLLIIFMLENWEVVSERLPRNALKSAIEDFVTRNVEAETKNHSLAKKPYFDEVKELCEELNERLKKPARKSKPKYRAVLVATLLAVAALVAGLILSDVKSHGGVWEKSDTYRFLKTKGIISVTTYIWAGLQHFYHVSYDWLKVNVPFYYHATTDILGPYFKELMSYLYSLMIMLMEASVPVKNWLVTNGSLALHYVGEWLKMAAQYFLDYLDVCIVYVRLGAIWLYQNMLLFYENVFRLYTGDVSWDDLRKAMLQYFDTMRLLFVTLLRKMGDYIAPNEP